MLWLTNRPASGFERRKEVRKIISILAALGLLLGLGLMATLAEAQPPCTMTCTPVDIQDLVSPLFCAGFTSNYLIGSVTPAVLPVTLIPGTDSLSVDFPADTDLSCVTAAGVTVFSLAAGAANPTSITVSGQHLEFMIPAAFLTVVSVLPAGDWIAIQVNGVINPTTADMYCLYLDYSFACCGPVQFDCGTYTVVPAIRTVDFHFDFDDTYTGIAEDYIPAFKACGIPGLGTNLGVGWVTDFDLILRDEYGGCSPPCATPSVFWFEVTKCPAGGTITFDIAGNTFTLTDADIGLKRDLLTLGLWTAWPVAPIDVSWQCYIHFSSPGDYELEFFLQCPAAPCAAGPTIVAQKPLSTSGYQWLDAEPEEGYCSVNWTGDVDTINDVEDATTNNTIEDDHEITANSEVAPSGGCFIATAAYGTPIAEEIEILREFRDKYLMTNPVGRALVEFYYRMSPSIAEFITRHPSLKPIVRAGLLPVVVMSTVAVNTTPTQKTAIIGLLMLVSVAVAVWATKRRSRRPKCA
jgi:hypothetical protein